LQRKCGALFYKKWLGLLPLPPFFSLSAVGALNRHGVKARNEKAKDLTFNAKIEVRRSNEDGRKWKSVRSN